MQKSNQVITALYSRLSCEDDLDGDSNSIINQKKILEEYAVKNRLPNVRHFIDGTDIIGLNQKTFITKGFTG